jgi:hypothetical protein
METIDAYKKQLEATKKAIEFNEKALAKLAEIEEEIKVKIEKSKK